jgi:hypothetical protein
MSDYGHMFCRGVPCTVWACVVWQGGTKRLQITEDGPVDVVVPFVCVLWQQAGVALLLIRGCSSRGATVRCARALLTGVQHAPAVQCSRVGVPLSAAGDQGAFIESLLKIPRRLGQANVFDAFIVWSLGLPGCIHWLHCMYLGNGVGEAGLQGVSAARMLKVEMPGREVLPILVVCRHLVDRPGS